MSPNNLEDTSPVSKRTRSSGNSVSSRTPLPSALAPDVLGSRAAEMAFSGEAEEGEGTRETEETDQLEVTTFDKERQQPAEGNENKSVGHLIVFNRSRLSILTGTERKIPVKGQTIMKTEELNEATASIRPIASFEDELIIHAPKKPTLEASWEAIEKEMRILEEGWMGGLKDDIDTLLVFAGLFSTVVTTFLVESYKWLEEAPEDTTVTLLRQISQQMDSRVVPSPLPPFKPSTSAVRINVLWFLSLTIGLVVALIGLLCKQWIREFRRQTHTHSPNDTVATTLHRSWSGHKWHVYIILTSLPMLLELALFLFFAGLLDFLHTRHPAPFAAVMSVVIFAGLFYLATTVIPTVDFIRNTFRLAPTSIVASPSLIISWRYPLRTIRVPINLHKRGPYSGASAGLFTESRASYALYTPSVLSFILRNTEKIHRRGSGDGENTSTTQHATLMNGLICLLTSDVRTWGFPLHYGSLRPRAGL
ncbi:hypothetical protein PQX77_018613 [Marasmius sp. AFHP31]|nr:hypothetical protein PQX77_018613 [Marasmius sp. AFHP31]